MSADGNWQSGRWALLSVSAEILFGRGLRVLGPVAVDYGVRPSRRYLSSGSWPRVPVTITGASLEGDGDTY
jgi:hypothetical protein